MRADMTVVPAGGLNLDVKRPIATCPVAILVERSGLVFYTDSKKLTTQDGNRQPYVCALE